MKIIIRSLLKFLMILAIVFFFFFSIIFVFYLFPFLKIKTDTVLLSRLLNVIFIPAYFNSLLNSLIISAFLYGIFVINYQKKCRLRSVFIATCFSTFLVFISLFIFNPDYNKLENVGIDDARLFFNEKVFFEYNHTPPLLFEKDFFEKELLVNITAKKDRQLISNCYPYDSVVGKYVLKNIISPAERKKVSILLQDKGYFPPTRFYFDKIEPKFIDNAIVMKGDKPAFLNYLTVNFLSRSIVLIDNNNEKYEFYKEDLNNLITFDDAAASLVFKNLRYTAFHSLRFNTILEKCLFWFSIVFFIFSVCILIITPTFPLLVIIIRLFLVIAFYVLSTYILQIYNVTNFYLPSNLSFIGPYLVSIIWFILAVLVNIIRIIFFNKNSLEKNL